jgi:hypothetical protein
MLNHSDQSPGLNLAPLFRALPPRSAKHPQTAATQSNSPDQSPSATIFPDLAPPPSAQPSRSIGWSKCAPRTKFFKVFKNSSAASLVKPNTNLKKLVASLSKRWSIWVSVIVHLGRHVDFAFLFVRRALAAACVRQGTLKFLGNFGFQYTTGRGILTDIDDYLERLMKNLDSPKTHFNK